MVAMAASAVEVGTEPAGASFGLRLGSCVSWESIGMLMAKLERM